VITELTGLPPGVIGFEASGKLETEDYRDIMLPAIKRAEADGDVRVVFVLREFGGMAAEAMWDDVKMGAQLWGKQTRIAVVTDLDWMRNLTAVFGWMTPGDVKHFPLAEQEAAIAWAAG
jgi:hypothetical protein